MDADFHVPEHALFCAPCGALLSVVSGTGASVRCRICGHESACRRCPRAAIPLPPLPLSLARSCFCVADCAVCAARLFFCSSCRNLVAAGSAAGRADAACGRDCCQLGREAVRLAQAAVQPQ